MEQTASFSAVTAVSSSGPGRFDAEVSPEWTIAGKPNGGYLLAIMARAAASVAPHQHVVAASAHYLHSPEPGPVTVQAELLRGGRSASQLLARMSQLDRPCVQALLTMSRLDPGTKPYWDRGLPAASIASQHDSVRLPGRTPTGVPVAIMDQVDVRIDPRTLGWASGRPSGGGELRGWLELPQGHTFDPTAQLYAVDALPPATFDINTPDTQAPSWVPTLELTAYVRALPVPGPVQILQRAQLVDAQRVDEVCFVWDRSGRLVAQCTQLAGIRLG